MKKKHETDSTHSLNDTAAVYKVSLQANNGESNSVFCGTQDEWRRHFSQIENEIEIEQGKFLTLEEANHQFEVWKNQYLKSRL